METTAAVMLSAVQGAAPASEPASDVDPGSGRSLPNIVYILCDDLGYGDIHCLNPARGKIPTPNVDRLASEGVRFTDAHADSAVCTPSRYGLLTGRYSWRTHLQSGVLLGYSEPLIPAGRLTVPMLLKNHGYYTACVGKWHLGLGLPKADADKPVGVHGDVPPVGTKISRAEQQKLDNVDYSQPITGGPTALGFDYFFGFAASMDMPPYVWIENDKAVAEPTEIGAHFRPGVQLPGFDPVDAVPLLVEKATQQIRQHCKPAGAPMFLYVPLTSPHGPHVPTPAFAGKSGLGTYADFVMETDWAVGEIMAALDAAGVADNTLLIFTSDNGCAPVKELKQLLAAGHYPSAQFRGYKTDIWDGGHRVPFIARWPGKIAKGSSSDQLMCLNDLLATCAAIAGAKLPGHAGEDSVNMLPAFLGTAQTALREELINHSGVGNFAIRQGKWKLEFCPGSGGWSEPKNEQAIKDGLPRAQLYRMDLDEGETKNLVTDEPQRVRTLLAAAEKLIHSGRSTPGPAAKNDTQVNLWRKVEPLDLAAHGGD